MKPQPKVEEVVIKIKDDPGRFTDVVVALHAKGFFDSIWKLRSEYDDYESYPIMDAKTANDHFRQKYSEIQNDQRRDKSLSRDIEDLRHNFHLSTHYEQLILKLILTGVIEDSDYRKAYYTKIPVQPVDGTYSEELHAIIIHQGTRREDLEAPLRTYLSQYEVKTKTGKTLRPTEIADVHEFERAYLGIMPSDYNPYVIDGFSGIEEYYEHYRQKVLSGANPQQLALKHLGYSQQLYNEAKATKESNNESYKIYEEVRLIAKSISEGIHRVEKLLHHA